MRCFVTVLVRSGTIPSRVITRAMWVSTGKTGIPSANSRTQAAVFGPTPSMPVNSAIASSTVRSPSFLPCRVEIAHRSQGLLDARSLLPREAPDPDRVPRPGRSARRSPRPTSGTSSRSEANAALEFRSVVLCDRIVPNQGARDVAVWPQWARSVEQVEPASHLVELVLARISSSSAIRNALSASLRSGILFVSLRVSRKRFHQVPNSTSNATRHGNPASHPVPDVEVSFCVDPTCRAGAD